MQSILISGGNSGIGREAARTILARGYRVVLLGRDPVKGRAALEWFGELRDHASFHAVDLSTHAGVRDAAKTVLDADDQLDGILHTTGVMTSADIRTADGLHVFFAVNYLSRYHLTQLLLPALRTGDGGQVVMMTAAVGPETAIPPAQFPLFEGFNFRTMRKPIQVANHHYAAHLARTEPNVTAGVVNAGAARTDILRMQPWAVRIAARALGPLVFDFHADSAHNAVEAVLQRDWAPATYWPKPAAFDRRVVIEVDEATTQLVIDGSRQLTDA